MDEQAVAHVRQAYRIHLVIKISQRRGKLIEVLGLIRVGVDNAVGAKLHGIAE